MRLCLFAFIGSDNLGDEAIFETVYFALQTLRPELLTILSMNSARTRRIATGANVRVLSARSPWATAHAICSSDVLVCGGGGMFQDQSSVYNPMRYIARVWIAQALRKPTFIYAVSVGPLQRRFNRALVGRVLRRASRITVRDTASMRELISLGVSEKIVHVTSDPVVNLSRASVARQREASQRSVVVCLRHWFDTINWLPVSLVNLLHVRTSDNTKKYRQFVSGMALALDELLEDSSVSLTFVPFWGARDTQVHDDVVSRMRQRTRCIVLRQSPSIAEADAIIGNADLVIGMRLHSLILAVANSRPFFALDYSKKVGDFIEEVLPGAAFRVSISPVHLDASALIAKLRGLQATSPFDMAYAASVQRLKLRELENLAQLRSLLSELGFLRAENASRDRKSTSSPS